MYKKIDKTPTEVQFIPDPDDVASRLKPADVEQIAQIFHTPLTGSYTWNYLEADKRIRKLYRLGKERNWNADMDVDWSETFPRTESPMNDTRPLERKKFVSFKKLLQHVTHGGADPEMVSSLANLRPVTRWPSS